MFCVYPTVSLASGKLSSTRTAICAPILFMVARRKLTCENYLAVLVYNCDPQVGRLKNDYREICPSLTSFDSLYSIFFVLLYRKLSVKVVF